MNLSSKSARVALFSAGLAVVAWSAKAVAIGVAGGLDKSPLETPFFFAGLITFVVAAVSLGVALTSGRAAWLRVVGGAAGLVGWLAVTTGVGAAVAAVEPVDSSWVWSEVELWIIALLALVAAWLVADRDRASKGQDVVVGRSSVS